MSGVGPAGANATTRSKLGFRQRFKQLVKHSTSNTTDPVVALPSLTQPQSTVPSSTLPIANPAVTTTTATAVSANNNTLLDRSLQHLTEQQRSLLQPHLPSGSSENVDDAIERVLSAAQQKQQQCIDKRWKFVVGGRQVLLREKADKVVGWVHRFKGVGDVVANADPLHVGLPWAAIRFLLEIAIADEEQMRALLAGCETALHMSNRLKAYTRFLQQVPDGMQKDNFDAALTKLYACLLVFLTQAIAVYEQSSAKRTITALWSATDITSFEHNCTARASDLEVAATNCDRVLQTQNTQVLSNVHIRLQQSLDKIDHYHTSLQVSLDRIEEKVDLSKLPYVKGAVYNSYDQVHTACHPATRQALLQRIQAWAVEPRSKSIFWLNGKAGTGKSTISFTMANWLDTQNTQTTVTLAASFFFKRGEGDRGSAQQFFPTLANQLADRIVTLRPLLAEALDSDHAIASKSLAEQFQKLIYHPLQELSLTPGSPIYVFVVDALDECDRDVDMDTILQLWPRLENISAITFKLLLTSRPEIPVREGFERMTERLHLDLALQEDIPVAVIHHDLVTYISDKLSAIQQRNDDRFRHRTLGNNWPGEKIVEKLADKAIPLFIVAATMMRFIEESVDSPLSRPDKRLGDMLNQATAGLSKVADLYSVVLNSISKNLDNPYDKNELYENCRIILGSIISLAEPLPLIPLAQLIDIDVADIQSLLHFLHSVLYVPIDIRAPIRTLHLSFSEFLTSKEIQDQPFAIDSRMAHRELVKHCLSRMSDPGGLRENICSLDYPGYLRKDIDVGTLDSCLSDTLRYACRYWIYHVKHSNIVLSDGDEVHAFLQKHFLHWLEVLSLIGRLAEVTEYISTLQERTIGTASTQILSFLEDARRFVLTFRSIAESSPLQLYSSATVFAPNDSVIKRTCGTQPIWIKTNPFIQSSFNSELQRFESHGGLTRAISFSHDGRLLAAAADDSLHIWEVQSGINIHNFHHEKELFFSVIAFSLNCSHIVRASKRGELLLYDLQTGVTVMNGYNPDNMPEDDEVFKGFSGTRNHKCLRISTDATQLASILSDETVRLWDARTGQMRRQLGEGIGWNFVGKFSPDGSLLPLSNASGRISIYRIESGQEVQSMQHDTGWAYETTFSPDGLLLASAAIGETIKLWEVQSGQQICRVERYVGLTQDLSFSRDSMLLVSASEDEIVRLWAVQTGREVQQLKGHTGRVHAVCLRPDTSSMASTSSDRTIRLWDISAGQMLVDTASISAARIPGEMQSDEEARNGWGSQDVDQWYLGKIRAVHFSPDGSLLVSKAVDETVKLWDVKTGREMWRLIGDEDYDEGFTKNQRPVTFSPDGTLFVPAPRNQAIDVWRVNNKQKEQRNFEGHAADVYMMNISANGSALVSASLDATVMWDLVTGQELWCVKGGKDILASGFSCDGTLFAIASKLDQFNRIVVRTVESGRAVRQLRVLNGQVSEICFSPDNSLLAWSRSHRSTINLVKLDTAGKMQLRDGKNRREWGYNAICFSPNSLLFAAGFSAGPINLWKVTTFELLACIDNEPNFYRCLKITCNKNSAYISNDCGSVFTFDTSLTDQENDSYIKRGDSNSSEAMAVTIKEGEHTVENGELGSNMVGEDQATRTAENIMIENDRNLKPWINQVQESTTNRAQRNEAILVEDDELVASYLSLDKGWIQFRKRGLLWLPHEHRGDVIAVHRNSLAIGKPTGEITFITFNPQALRPFLDTCM